MLCRRVSFSGSSPRTGRSRSSSIRRGWRSGNRFRPPAETHSPTRRNVPVPPRWGSCVSRRTRISLCVGSLCLALVAGAGVSLAAPSPQTEGAPGLPSPTPTPPPPPEESGPSPQPAPPPPPSPAPSPPSAAPPPQAPNREPAAPAPGAEVTTPAGKPESEEGPPAASPEAGKGVIGHIVVDGNVRVSDSAFFSNLKIKSGDPYDERTIQ